MCTVSMIGDWFSERHTGKPWIVPNVPGSPDLPNGFSINLSGVSREEFDQLKKEVQILKELLEKAVIYDAKNNEPNCETDEKMKLLRAIAEKVGVKLD